MNVPGSGQGGERTAYRTRNERQNERSKTARSSSLPRAMALTTLSALMPGLGLLGTRRRKVGVALILLLLLGLILVGAYALNNGLTDTALQTAADPVRLRVIVGVMMLGTVVWVMAIALTALLSQPQRTRTGQQIALSLLTAALAVAVSMPAAVGMRYIDAHLSAVDKVFASGSGGGGAGGSLSNPRVTSAVGDDASDPWKDLPRVNLLVLGSDAAEAREGTRTDTMMVVSIDTTTGDSVIFSIPRNLQRVPIPRDNPLSEAYPTGFDCGDECLMNGIWTAAEAFAEEHPELYTDDPTPGATATREVLSAVIGQPIHHTVIVNLQGFRDLIDAMGGVTINVQEPIPLGVQTYTDAEGRLQMVPGSERGWLEPGVQRLDGRDALDYSRSRVTSDDFGRMRRQRCMVAAVVDQVNPMTMLQRYPQIISAVGDNVATDIPQQDLDEWAALVLEVQGATIQSLPFTSQNTDVINPNFSEIRYRVYDALYASPAPEPPPTAAPSTDDAPATTAPPVDEEVGVEQPVDETIDEPPADELTEIGTVCG